MIPNREGECRDSQEKGRGLGDEMMVPMGRCGQGGGQEMLWVQVCQRSLWDIVQCGWADPEAME